jgi:hypothetical protein
VTLRVESSSGVLLQQETQELLKQLSSLVSESCSHRGGSTMDTSSLGFEPDSVQPYEAPIDCAWSFSLHDALPPAACFLDFGGTQSMYTRVYCPLELVELQDARCTVIFTAKRRT